jgi:hypothetical protein
VGEGEEAEERAPLPYTSMFACVRICMCGQSDLAGRRPREEEDGESGWMEKRLGSLSPIRPFLIRMSRCRPGRI